MKIEDMEKMKEFDSVTQMQLDEFVRSMASATNAKLAIVIVETPDALQSSIRLTGDDEASSKMECIRALCTVAAAALEEETKGAFKLMIQTPDGRHMLALSGEAIVATRRR